MTRRADAFILAGLGLVVVGILLIYPPLALIAGGAGLAAFGLLGVEVKR
jgi:hypothetical protein